VCVLFLQVKALADKLEDKDRRLLQMAKSQQQQQQQQQQQNSSSTHSSLQSAASERSTVRSEPRDDEAMSKLKERFVTHEKNREAHIFFAGKGAGNIRPASKAAGGDGGFQYSDFFSGRDISRA
jgi:hypothetical protein